MVFHKNEISLNFNGLSVKKT